METGKRNYEYESISKSEHSVSQPTILTRSRKEKESPPEHRLTMKLSQETISALAPPLEMKHGIKIIGEYMSFNSFPIEYLQDQNDFTVVGVLGLQGVGKSTIMSLLASSNSGSRPFKIQGAHRQAHGMHCTNGVDLYITSNRMFLLDTQPLLSASIMDKMIQQEYKKCIPITAEYSSPENVIEIQSLQVISFILSVCHVVIVIQEYFFDLNVIRLIQSAEMLKPSTPTMSEEEELIDYFPHVMFLHNWALPCDFSSTKVTEAQKLYSQAFQGSRLQTQSGMGIANGKVINLLNPDICGGELFNYYLIPDLAETKDDLHFKGYPDPKKLIECLKHQLLSVHKQSLTPAPLSEKKWLQYASKVWDEITKSDFFLEYSQLLP